MHRLRLLALGALALPSLLVVGCAGCADAPIAGDAGSVIVPPAARDAGTGACVVDEDCPFGETCRNGACRPSEPSLHDEGCWRDEDCREGKRCATSSGRCVDEASFPDAPPAEEGECADGETRFCGSKVGACEYGSEPCVDGAWSGVCEGGVRPAASEGCDGQDDDCDGETDEDYALGVQCADGEGVCRQEGVTVCSDDGGDVVCSAVALDATGLVELCANNLDDDCNGQTDEGFTLNEPCTAGVGACARGGVTVCTADGLDVECSATAGEPAANELCGGDPDDDCDGELEEGFETVDDTCNVGLGACARQGQWICTSDLSGVRCSVSAPLGNPAELCGGHVDDDCDGVLEENDGWGAVGDPCSVGSGSCQVPGTYECSGDGSALVCVPSSSGSEVCDGDDNDGDSCVDEDFDVGASCFNGVGACRRQGQKECKADESGTQCDAVPASPGANELCDNNIDDNCNGSTDEGFPLLGTPCTVGQGICRRSGAYVCSADRLGVVCDATPGNPDPYGELCGNNLDDNCNGSTDEGFPTLGNACSDGVGICQRTGQVICRADGKGTRCSATAGAPDPRGELCGNVLDDDCDGALNNGYDLGAACVVGQGICQNSGQLICDGQLATKCSVSPLPPDPRGELCGNGLNDDCDAATDEGFEAKGSACTTGLGECAKSGVLVCTSDLLNLQCSVAPGTPVPELCDNKDNDCNGATDNGCDDDGDDYCDALLGFLGLPTVCPRSTSSSLRDCNDDEASINPGAAEICFDGRDQNCNGDNSEGCPVCNPSIDKDFDGANECVDCDDSNGAVFPAVGAQPAATERCDGLDNDCDGLFDETFDVDGDNYTTCGTLRNTGGTPEPSRVDCNDGNSAIHPNACELCAAAGGGNAACGNIGVSGNGVDEDCDGYQDENCAPCSNVDSDGDGQSQCAGDCAPSDGQRYTGNTELCDGVDNDCNIYTTENCGVGDGCNWSGGADVCREGLICGREIKQGGQAGDWICTSWCNSSNLNLGLGDGCASGEACWYNLTASANIHGCGRVADLGTLQSGVNCSSDAQCRSGRCYKDQRFTGGQPPQYCTDLCGSDDYCANGTTCQQWGGDARCYRVHAAQTKNTGDACTLGTTTCKGGYPTCLNMNGTNRCTEACCTNTDCPAGWFCSLNGSEWGSYVGWRDTVPVCWPESASNGDRPAGAACDANAQCASEFCDKTLSLCVEVCCNDDTCPTGLSCQDVEVKLASGNLTQARMCLNVTPSATLEKK